MKLGEDETDTMHHQDGTDGPLTEPREALSGTYSLSFSMKPNVLLEGPSHLGETELVATHHQDGTGGSLADSLERALFGKYSSSFSKKPDVHPERVPHLGEEQLASALIRTGRMEHWLNDGKEHCLVSFYYPFP